MNLQSELPTDLPPVPFKDSNEQAFANNLYWLASQNCLPLPPSAFPASAQAGALDNNSLLATSLPPELVANYHQWFANYQQILEFSGNADLFNQYPPITAINSQPQSYPSLGQSALDLPNPAGHGDSSFKSYHPPQPLSLDMSFMDSPTSTDISCETSPTSPSQLSESPDPEESPKARRHRRKSSTDSSLKSRKSSPSSKSSNVDRIRERNRISAQRFRDKKKADAIDLELKTHKLSKQRNQLIREITDLQWQSILLQEQCLRQTMCECDDVKSFFKNKTSLHEKLCQTELQCHT